MAANDQRAKHDAVLDFMLEKHGADASVLLDTVVHFLSRKTDFCFEAQQPAAKLLAVLAGVTGGAVPAKPPAAAAAAAAGEAPAAGPPEPAAEALAPGEYLVLPVTLSSSGKAALEKDASKVAATKDSAAGGEDTVAVGTTCKHSGCELAFQGPGKTHGDCVYHPGQPVFHEGYKYWSCCKVQKTTEFSEFMSFPGCTKGSCMFTEDASAKAAKAKCRTDFYQYGKTATLSIFAKLAQPDLCEFKATSDKLFVSLTFGPGGSKTTAMEIALAGPIDPTKSKVEIVAPKVEITLFKAGGEKWDTIGAIVDQE